MNRLDLLNTVKKSLDFYVDQYENLLEIQSKQYGIDSQDTDELKKEYQNSLNRLDSIINCLDDFTYNLEKIG